MMPEYLEKEAFKSWMEENITKNPVILKSIDYAPSADVEPVRHGSFRMLTFSGDTIICSECKMAYNIFETNGAENFNFCPNCGAKMDKENSE